MWDSTLGSPTEQTRRLYQHLSAGQSVVKTEALDALTASPELKPHISISLLEEGDLFGDPNFIHIAKRRNAARRFSISS
jgi:hypothetical protein